MSIKVLVNDYPHRTLALATDDYVLVFRHAHSADSGRDVNLSNLPLPDVNRNPAVPRCMVEFAARSTLDLKDYRTLAVAKGTLGLVTFNQDVFICVITGSVEVATVRPKETVQKIYAVDFYCLNRPGFDHSLGQDSNPHHGQAFISDEFDYGGGFDQGDSTGEHPFHTLKKLLSGGNFYYSIDFDLTRRLQDRIEIHDTIDITSLDDGLLWNSYMIDPLLQFRSRLTRLARQALDQSGMLTSVIRGFVKTLMVPQSSSPIRRKASNLAASLTVISRLSSRRAGTRFNSRGVDDDGNVANFVETETVFWSPTGLCFSYTQIRGSVPIFWESSSSLIPGQQKISITRSPEATQPSFDKHFSMLERNYGTVHIVNLLSAVRPGELELTERYRYHISQSPLVRREMGELEEHDMLRQTEFDFNERTKGVGGYEGARAIRPAIDASAEAFVYFLSEEIAEETKLAGEEKHITRPVIIMQQNGVFRVNCLDCLDRTNLVQGMISQMALEQFLSHRDERGNPDFWTRHSALWADNGDSLSRIYAGTGALKSSFTRHGKMSLAGAIADARKSATRLYVNHFEDKGRQNTVDLLLGRLVGQTVVEIYDPVNEWVGTEIGRHREEFETRAQLKVWVGTYNLNGKTTGIKDDLGPWLDAGGADFDMVVIGFQEIVELSPQQIMSTDPSIRIAWETAVRGCLNTPRKGDKSTSGYGDDYVLLRSGQLVGAALMIFVRSSMLTRVKNVEGTIKKTGMSGIAGNKGAVAIRMEVESTTVCFVTAHLAAGFGNYDERNRDYNTITSGLRFQRNRGIEDHEVIVWAGDFNYRIGLGYEKARALVKTVAHKGHDAESALAKLYENDQLNIQMVFGNCFGFYREGKIGFLPTYKFDLGRDDYDSSEKQRIPAWTDRVVWKVNQKNLQHGDELGSKMKQLDYNSVMSMRFSDHRPVYATFELGVRVIDETKKDALTKKLYHKRLRDIKAKTEIGRKEIESESDDADDLMGYQSIQEGLPPASSDRRKWWLDGNKGVMSDVGPPKEGMMLNKDREANPWRAGGADDWVKIEKPARSISNGRRDLDSGLQEATSQKPNPPPSRTARRVAPPPWEGERHVNQSNSTSTTPRQSGTSEPQRSPAPPIPPHGRNEETSSQTQQPHHDHHKSMTNSAPTTLKKQPPPKPIKPSALRRSSSASGAPRTITPTDRSSPPETESRRSFSNNPPPLPRRTNTSTSTSSTLSTRDSSSSAKPLPPPRKPRRRVIPPQSQIQDQDWVNFPSRSPSNGITDVGPPLPPRRTGTDLVLMDADNQEDADMSRFKALVPR